MRMHAGGAVVVGLSMLAQTGSGPSSASVRSDARRLHGEAIVVDTHADTTQRLLHENFDLSKRHDDGHVDVPRMREGGLDAVFFSIWVPVRTRGAEAVKGALDQIDAVREAVRAAPDDLVLATTAAEVREAHARGRIAVLMGMEGGHMIDDDLRVLRMYAALGVRYLTLTHTASTSWADSSADPESHWGLTPFGRQVVAELNRLGVIVDVSHVSDATFWDALEASRAPIIASHSSMRALANHPRNMTDEMVQALGARGGVIQINYLTEFLSQERIDAGRAHPEIDAAFKEIETRCGEDDACQILAWSRLERQLVSAGTVPAVSWERILDHIDRAVKLAGVDHVGLGSDFDGAFMPDGLEDVSRLPRITEGLLARGYSPDDIRKILGGNTLRVMEDVERTAHRIREEARR